MLLSLLYKKIVGIYNQNLRDAHLSQYFLKNYFKNFSTY